MGEKRSRVRALATAAVLTAAVVCQLATAPAASAKQPKGTGAINCSEATGAVTFSPPWSDAGTGTVKGKVKFTATGCSGGTPTPSSVNGSVSFMFANGHCSTYTVAIPNGTVRLTYNHVVAPSKVKGSVSFDTTGLAMFLDGGVTSGSYPESQPDTDIGMLGEPSVGTCSTGVSKLAITGGIISTA